MMDGKAEYVGSTGVQLVNDLTVEPMRKLPASYTTTNAIMGLQNKSKAFCLYFSYRLCL